METKQECKEALDGRLREPKSKAEGDAFELEYQVRQALVRARANKNLTQVQLANIAGINQSEISRYEKGTAHPSLKTLDRLARGMGMRLRISFVSPDEAI